MEADFSGWATKAGLKCSDGRTIMEGAFQHQDKVTVPLVWHHLSKDANNILGHAVLEHRNGGVYTHAFFNDTPQGQNAKALVKHKDVQFMSIRANDLVQRGGDVQHGNIREVSLVIAGANPGAVIENINLEHADGHITELDDEVLITTGLEIEHEDKEAEVADGKTNQEVFDSLNEEQKNLFYAAVAEAAGVADETSDEESNPEAEHSADDNNDADGTSADGDNLEHQEGGSDMTRSIFEQNGDASPKAAKQLTHAQMATVFERARSVGSLKRAMEELVHGELIHDVEYGIEDIDLLFPDAKAITDAPDFVKRRTEWVNVVLSGTSNSPFSRIKTLTADITHDEARAKGYVKATLKKEEWFKLTKRVTTPKTVYKKQKLDRDDILDISDFNVVAWLKAEMRIMLEEEIARAILLGDGREVDDPDKIDEDHIRPIAYDDDFYAHKVVLPTNVTSQDAVENIIRERDHFRGSGTPIMFTTWGFLSDLLLAKDKMNRRLYNSKAELADALMVSDIVPVEVMEGYEHLLAVLVNLRDYRTGTDKGGQITMFDDFDIDYNQEIYLLETRLSGALVKWKSALIISRTAGTEVATLTAPTFNTTTGVGTIPAQTGVVWKNADTDVVLTAGAQTAIASGATVEYEATAASGYYLKHGIDTDFEFTRD